jgi:hypothetical protein
MKKEEKKVKKILLEEQEENLNVQVDILKELLDLHYNGIMHISNFYKIGDIIPDVLIRNEDLDERVDLVVIGIEHDIISTTNNTNAALTLSQVRPLSKERPLSKYNYFPLRNDYMSYYIKKYAHYSTSDLREWLNSIYYNALPKNLQNLIKPVNKITAEPKTTYEYPTESVVHSIEKCFIPSCYEVFGKGYITEHNHGIKKVYGKQYEYYKAIDNRKKSLLSSKSNNSCWWTRDAFLDSGSKF